MKPIRLGIIGTGIASRLLHYPALKQLNNKFTIAAACNRTEPKAKSYAKLVGGVPYTLDYRQLLRRSDIDAVVIALPIDLTTKVTLAALRAGKHVFVEKPLGASVAETKKLLAEERKHPNQVAMLAENFRFRQVFLRAQELLKKEVIGKPYAAVWNLYYHVLPSSIYAKTWWRKDNHYPGGFITDAGVHNIAVFRMLFGEVKGRSAFAKSVEPRIGSLDTMSYQFETQRGVQCTYNIFFSVNGHWENSFLIFGTNGTIWIGEDKLTVQRAGRKDSVERFRDRGGGFKAEFEDFHRAIMTGKRVKSTFTEGARDLGAILEGLKLAGDRS